MAGKKIYGIKEADRGDMRGMLTEYRAARPGRTFELNRDTGMVMAMILFRPNQFDAGLCVKLDRDPLRPFVYIVSLLGYPAISGRGHYTLTWKNARLGTKVEVKKIPIYATAAQFHNLIPDEIIRHVQVKGGSMTATHLGAERKTQTGRWFLSFSEYPEWRPSFSDMTDPRIQGRVEIHDITLTETYAEFRTLASISQPFAIHPGSMAMGWYGAGVLRLGPIEARIYQEYEGNLTASYSWQIGPPVREAYEGDDVVIDISLQAWDQDRLDGTMEISVFVEWEMQETMDWSDLVGSLDDWILTAIAGVDGWSWSDGRLTYALSSDETSAAIRVRIPTVEDGILEGDQWGAMRLSRAKSSTGVIQIDQNVCGVKLQDRDGAVFGIYGPQAAVSSVDVDYTLTIEGVFLEGAALSIHISQIGTALEEDTTDWASLLADSLTSIPGATFDPETGRIIIITEASGGIPAIPITVGFLPLSSRKTFGFNLANPEIVGGSARAFPFTIMTDIDGSWANFKLFGSTTATPGSVRDYRIEIAGYFKVGAVLSVAIQSIGSASVDDVDDWKTALLDSLGSIPGASFDRDSGLITITIRTAGSLPSISIPAGFMPSSAGKTFGFSLSGPQITDGTAISEPNQVLTSIGS